MIWDWEEMARGDHAYQFLKLKRILTWYNLGLQSVNMNGK